MWQSGCLTIILYKSEELANQFFIALIQGNRCFGGTIGQFAPVWGPGETRVFHILYPDAFYQHTGMKEKTVVPGCPTASWLKPTSILVPPSSLPQSLRWTLSPPPHFVQRTSQLTLLATNTPKLATLYFWKFNPHEVKTPFHNA